VTGYERLEAALIRRALEEAEEQVTAQNRHIEALARRGKETDYGPQQVFLTWRDRCFDAKDKVSCVTHCGPGLLKVRC
jgi:hypothetical protein